MANIRKSTQKVMGKPDAVCPVCGAVYFDKHWHSAPAKWFSGQASMEKRRCEECRLRKSAAAGNAPYAGELTIEGLKDEKERQEAVGLVRNAGKRAMKRDPEDRIVSITVRGAKIVVLTSENQLAVAIGKQLHQARKRSDLTITWSAQDKPVRVQWKAK